MGAFASVAQAQATVRIEVHDANAAAADAEVTLVAESGGRRYSCHARAGVCEIGGVDQGMYVVTAEPRGEGQAPLPRRVMVPDNGTPVTIRIRLR